MQLVVHNRGQHKVFAFDRVFDAYATQEVVYEDSKSLIRSVLDGACFRHMYCDKGILLLTIPAPEIIIYDNILIHHGDLHIKYVCCKAYNAPYFAKYHTSTIV